jgi:hypothetical protein
MVGKNENPSRTEKRNLEPVDGDEDAIMQKAAKMKTVTMIAMIANIAEKNVVRKNPRRKSLDPIIVPASLILIMRKKSLADGEVVAARNIGVEGTTIVTTVAEERKRRKRRSTSAARVPTRIPRQPDGA